MFPNNKPEWFGTQLQKHILSLQNGDFRSIPWIFCVFSESHSQSKTKAARALSEVLDVLTFEEIVHIDKQMRQTTSMEWSINWRDYSIDSFFTTEMSERDRTAVVVFASFNPNGYIREQAVRLMKDYDGTLPFVLLRQSDWVLKVREAAVKAVDYRFTHLTKGELITALPFADKLSRSGRAQQGESSDAALTHIFIMLTSPENEKELTAGLSNANIRTRRICIKALFNQGNKRFDLAFDRLKRETDPFLRATIFQKLRSAGQSMEPVADMFLRDKYPLNRVLAFEYICNTDKGETLQTAEHLLLDKNAAVREAARCYIKSQLSSFDFRAFYRRDLNEYSVTAIYGLGETGITEDTAVLEKYQSCVQVSVVRATMTALMRLDGNKYAQNITEYLNDDRVGIVKTARNLILKTELPDYTRIMEIFRATPYTNTKSKCFSILLTASKWQCLIHILYAIEYGGEETKEASLEALRRWMSCFNKSYTSLNAQQDKQIRDSMQKIGRMLPLKLEQELLFLLR